MRNKFVDYVLDILSPYGDIKAKAMFGGYGIYKNSIIVGIIVQNELYFKTDKTSVSDYELAGSKPFSYTTKNKVITMSYWQVPAKVLEDEKLLEIWLERASQISLKAKSAKNQ